MNEANIAILIPSVVPYWPSKFALCLLNMSLLLQSKVVPGYSRVYHKIINEKGSIIPKGRQSLIDMAVKAKATHALFVDTDQTFPADAAHLMLQRHKPVVAANVATKSIPASPTARKKSADWFGGDKVYTDPSSKGLEEVWRIGFGMMLIDLSILPQLERPYFGLKWHEEIKDWTGEDWWFCERLEKAGIPIYIDHDLSRDVGHLGEFEYTHALVGEIQQPKAVNE